MIRRLLNKFPLLKKVIKRIYLIIGALFSSRKKIKKLSPISSRDVEHLFGYYDKSPWNFDNSKLIYIECKNSHKKPDSNSITNIILRDEKGEKVIAQTRAWNSQQGCMLQWLGPDYSNKLIYNDYLNECFVSVILDIKNGNVEYKSAPVYSVSSDGKFALTLDFDRLHYLRPGYGYSNRCKPSYIEKIPNGYCIWKLNIDTNRIEEVISYEELLSIKHKKTMNYAYHKVNHIMISPRNDSFIFLHRWIVNEKKYDRLLYYSFDKKQVSVILDEDMVSHCNWIDNDNIILFAHTYKNGNGYYKINVKTNSIEYLSQMPEFDGHPSISPDGKYLITDSYPNFKRTQQLILADTKTFSIIGSIDFFANPRYYDDCRCDFHPRWSRDSSTVCFDGTLIKKRQVYCIPIEEIKNGE